MTHRGLFSAVINDLWRIEQNRFGKEYDRSLCIQIYSGDLQLITLAWQFSCLSGQLQLGAGPDRNQHLLISQRPMATNLDIIFASNVVDLPVTVGVTPSSLLTPASVFIWLMSRAIPIYQTTSGGYSFPDSNLGKQEN